MFLIKVLIVCAVVVFAAVVGSAILIHSHDEPDFSEENIFANN